ncbi:hypothetical protein OS493_033207 [Desmophyllum pertusum]|uniref:Uncharacterized protein n=1 Tax=Desmophyllum pertusum TaxID=174260 RepID=A0A9X0CCY7_9CNID|nr:hypothetical protein OS493_033207 [Desmophyllum pertusum]
MALKFVAAKSLISERCKRRAKRILTCRSPAAVGRHTTTTCMKKWKRTLLPSARACPNCRAAFPLPASPEEVATLHGFMQQCQEIKDHKTRSTTPWQSTRLHHHSLETSRPSSSRPVSQGGLVDSLPDSLMASFQEDPEDFVGYLPSKAVKGSAKRLFQYNSEGSRTVHKNENGAFYANVKISKGYRKDYIPESEVYELTRYYNTSKFNPEFSRTIATVKAITDKELKPFYLVLYKWAAGERKEFFLPRHGNAKKSRLHRHIFAKTLAHLQS